MATRGYKPHPSRKSDFTADPPSTIYSQAPAEFKPPADYVGPGEKYMRRPPDRSMNPKTLSLPILSVAKLNVTTNKPSPSKKTDLPTLIHCQYSSPKSDFAKSSRKFLESRQAKKILNNMPSVFRKQFRPELKKARPMRGCIRHFMPYDFHEKPLPENAVLHGVVLLGGDHRDMVEEAPQDTGTPPPLSGRRHSVAQTETWLEDIADYEVEVKNTEMQCEAIYDEPLQPTQLNFEKETETTVATQLDSWVFSNLEHAFDQVVVNLSEAVIMESLKQLQEEFELEALRKQHDYHICLRNREISILGKYKAAQAKYEQQKKYLDNNKTWEEELDRIIEEVGFEKIRDIAPDHFVQGRIDRAIYEHVYETVVPPINSAVTEEVETTKESRNLLDSIIEEVVMIREAEHAGRMYIGDPFMKGSLATDSPSKQSFGSEEEWEEEFDG